MQCVRASYAQGARTCRAGRRWGQVLIYHASDVPLSHKRAYVELPVPIWIRPSIAVAILPASAANPTGAKWTLPVPADQSHVS